MDRPRSIRPLDITPDGAGLLVTMDDGREFVLDADPLAVALTELGYTVVTPWCVAVEVPEKPTPGDG